MPRIRTVSAYFGGKASHLKHLLPILEAIPHKFYVEPFGGTAALLLNKRPSFVEVYNDRDAALVSLMRCIRERRQELQEAIALTPYSRLEMLRCRETLKAGEADELETARCAWVLLKTTFNSSLTNGGFSTGGACRTGNVARELHNTSAFEGVARRLQGVVLECADYKELFSLYNSTEALMYLDPPYHPDTRKSKVYRFEWDKGQHRDFVQTILKAKGAVVVSGYDHADYADLTEGGWLQIKYKALTMQASKCTGRAIKEESIWLSPYAATHQQSRGLFDKVSLAESEVPHA